MKSKRSLVASMALLVLAVSSPAAHAQWAVIDVGAIAQLIQEVQTAEQALSTARGQLAQAQQEYRAITGGRGMEQLLSGIDRNYLPSSGTELDSLLNQLTTSYGALGTAMQTAIRGNAVLSDSQLAELSPDAAMAVQRIRRSAALMRVITDQALSAASARFSTLQQLIGAIPGAADQKAIMDLNARIAAEQNMVQNEQTKLQALYREADAQMWTEQQRIRESVVAGHGIFTTRFSPALR
ncbi:MAG TPA: type IV secretion system protein [Steroidobacteraceae bacterium]|nr:type IV secretion system protein [Steroidobacteraceae bacterium]